LPAPLALMRGNGRVYFSPPPRLCAFREQGKGSPKSANFIYCPTDTAAQ